MCVKMFPAGKAHCDVIITSCRCCFPSSSRLERIGFARNVDASFCPAISFGRYSLGCTSQSSEISCGSRWETAYNVGLLLVFVPRGHPEQLNFMICFALYLRRSISISL